MSDLNQQWVDAEQAVIGALIIQPSIGLELEIGPQHFPSESMRQIFEAIQELQSSAEPIDVLTVAEHLERTTGKPWLALVGGIVRAVPGAANAKAYAGVLLESFRRRNGQRIAEELLGNPDQVGIDIAIRDLMALSATRKTFEVTGKQAMMRAMEITDDATHGVTGAPTGLHALDSCLGGFHRGDLIIIGARPAIGKTAFMVNLAVKGKSRAGIISSEQGHEQLGMRMAGVQAGVSIHKMRIGSTSVQEYQSIADAVSNPINSMLWINDRPGISIEEIQRQARKWKFERGIDALYVDYLQRLKCANVRLPRREQVGEIVRALKELARELDIPVIVLAQLNREVEKRGGRPFVSDLGDSGDIEREADQVLLLHRDDPENGTTLDVFVGKNRHGPTGSIALGWIREIMSVTNIETRWGGA